MAVGGSIYLGYVLYFILQELCPVCISTYIINLLLFISRLENVLKLIFATINILQLL